MLTGSQFPDGNRRKPGSTIGSGSFLIVKLLQRKTGPIYPKRSAVDEDLKASDHTVECRMEHCGCPLVISRALPGNPSTPASGFRLDERQFSFPRPGSIKVPEGRKAFAFYKLIEAIGFLCQSDVR